jgi:hypothetical protein
VKYRILWSTEYCDVRNTVTYRILWRTEHNMQHKFSLPWIYEVRKMTVMMMMIIIIIITMIKIWLLEINDAPNVLQSVFNADVCDFSTETGDNYINCNKTAYTTESHFRLPTTGNVTPHFVLIFAKSYWDNKLQHTDKTASLTQHFVTTDEQQVCTEQQTDISSFF